MATPPSVPPLHVVLHALEADFELTNEQLAILPPPDEVELVPQFDSHLIEHAEIKVFTYHPYKLFIGEHENDPFYAYLIRTGERKQYQIELCSVDEANETYYPPMDARWYGTVKNLAYPYNTFLGVARFVAVVKWYFLLAFRAGEFDGDSGFSLTTSWRNELQGASNELLAAPRKEESRRMKDLEKKVAEAKRAVVKEHRKSQDTVKQQAIEVQKTSAKLPQPTTEVDDRSRRRTTRKSTPLATDRAGDNDSEGRQLRQSVDRRTSFPSRLPPLHHFEARRLDLANANDPRRRRDPSPEGLRQLPPPSPYLRDARSPHYRSDQTEASSLRYEQPRRDERRTMNAMFINKKEQDATRMSWTEGLERLTSTEKDEVKETKMKEQSELTGEYGRAQREEEWMRLYTQKVEITRRMRDLEDEMTVEEKLHVFDRVKHA